MKVKHLISTLETFDPDLEVTLSFELDGEGHTVSFDPNFEEIETDAGDVVDMDIGDVEDQEDYEGIPDILDGEDSDDE